MFQLRFTLPRLFSAKCVDFFCVLRPSIHNWSSGQHPPPLKMSSKLNLKQLAQSRQKKIDSPLAKYNSTGQLFCVLCNAQIKNEIYWTGHVNGKQHKDNLSNLKKSGPPPPQTGTKRPASDTVAQPPQKVSKVEETDTVKRAEEELKLLIGSCSVEKSNDKVEGGVEGGEVEEQKISSAPLPEGFFDDPKEDAKARGRKFREPQDVEWEKFVKEIASEDVKSSEIVGVEQEQSAVERELEFIEDQMAQWQRVIELEKKAEDWKKKNAPSTLTSTGNSEMEVESEEEDSDYDEELDWRNKKR